MCVLPEELVTGVKSRPAYESDDFVCLRACAHHGAGQLIEDAKRVAESLSHSPKRFTSDVLFFVNANEIKRDLARLCMTLRFIETCVAECDENLRKTAFGYESWKRENDPFERDSR